MHRRSSYQKFIILTCFVIFTLIFLTMQNEKNHIAMVIEDLVIDDTPMAQVRTFNSDSETRTSDRVVKTKTRYPDGMHVPFLINNKNMCRKYEKISALVMVHTSVGNFWRRKEMRRTWLNSSYYSPENLQVIFLVGTTSNKTATELLKNESKKYHDIIQGDFVDTYRNLTNKGVMGYRWITENCMNAEIVIKIDDDAFINFLKFFEEFSYLKQRKRFIFCNKIYSNSMPIIRQNSSKWFVSEWFYKGRDTYPHTYCSGFVVFISTDLIPALYQAVFTAPFFWVDDFYLFGLLPSRVKNVVHENFRGNLTFMHPDGLKCYKKFKRKCKYLVMPAKDKELEAMWKAVIADRHQSIYGNYYMKERFID